jgi:hypothetical protein
MSGNVPVADGGLASELSSRRARVIARLRVELERVIRSRYDPAFEA